MNANTFTFTSQPNTKYEIVRKYTHAPYPEEVEGLDYFDTYHEAENFLRTYFNNGEYETDEFGKHRYFIREISEREIDVRFNHWANQMVAAYMMD